MEFSLELAHRFQADVPGQICAAPQQAYSQQLTSGVPARADCRIPAIVYILLSKVFFPAMFGEFSWEILCKDFQTIADLERSRMSKPFCRRDSGEINYNFRNLFFPKST